LGGDPVRVQIASDLHIEFDRGFRLDDVDRDLLVLAGDIGERDSAEKMVLEELKRSPIVYVPGNHEYYFGDIKDVDEKWYAFAEDHEGFVYCPLGAVPIEYGDETKVILCGTMWSDFWGEEWRENIVRMHLNDFALIRRRGARFTPLDSIVLHQEFRKVFMAHQGHPDMVVTHFAPSRKSIHPKYQNKMGDVTNCYYALDCEDLIEKLTPKIWVHGHTHTCFDYRIGSTRVLANPKGYRDENKDFNSALVVEI
jgi:predicted phosphodiesterase